MVVNVVVVPRGSTARTFVAGRRGAMNVLGGHIGDGFLGQIVRVPGRLASCYAAAVRPSGRRRRPVFVTEILRVTVYLNG